ncbi:YmfQ family protein [Polaromonas sp. JS666]|uniref:YmfQ family protein n=1 Tax=Polaromonas sp. (strain JS666 / ATCC BAA-500) TaxID=296591 RepID=UPI0000464B6B|nr:YmfQ family protein [Polaromonas sp. JS666]ABE45631.1 conserved hypothetical protein [Polaromonas sp. JS666]
MALTVSQYVAHLQALLPQGPAWSREPDSVTTKLLQGLAEELARLDARFDDLVEETDVRSTTELLTDWERVLGLPDDCLADQALSLIERRRLAQQRLVEQGGQSASYFLGLAELLGEPGCTITEFRPMNCNDDCNDALYSPEDRFSWRVNIPHAAVNARPMNCNDDCNDPLDLSSPSLIVCPITERKPAHTNVFFAYTA